MPVSRLIGALQNVPQFFRFIAAWALALGTGGMLGLLSLFIEPRKLWVRWRTPWARATLWLLRIRVEVEGQQHLRGPGIFIANHNSLIDVVVVPAIVPPTTRFVAKQELKKIPLWGWAFAASGALLIDRRNARLASESLTRGLGQLPPAWSLVVFPEGTRSRDGQLQRFKRGAFNLALASKLPLIPMGLVGTQAIIGHKGWFVRPGVVRVRVGAPLPTTLWRTETLREHMAEGARAVATCIAQAQAGGTPEVATSPTPEVGSVP